MKHFIVAICALGAASGSFPVVQPANAATSACSCMATPAEGVAFGSVVESSGKVTIAGPKGVKPVTPGTQIAAGASLFTANASKASVAFGSGCSVKLGENATLVVERVEGKLCPKVTELSVTSSKPASYGAPVGGREVGSGHVPFFVVGGFLALSATFLVVSFTNNNDDDDNGGPVSP